MARPAKQMIDRRRRHVAVRLTDTEHDHLLGEAKALGTTPSDLLRTRAFGVRLKPRTVRGNKQMLDAASRVELGRVGNNLNQIARALNTDPKAGAVLATEIRVELARIAALLIGSEP